MDRGADTRGGFASCSSVGEEESTDRRVGVAERGTGKRGRNREHRCGRVAHAYTRAHARAHTRTHTHMHAHTHISLGIDKSR